MTDANGWIPSDYDTLLSVAEAGRLEPDWLLAVFAAESELRPTARNRQSGAAGLNQMMPPQLAALGWRPGHAAYDAAGGDYTRAPVGLQITMAGAYFAEWRDRFGLPRWPSRAVLYLANLLPARIPLAGDPDAVLLDRERWPTGYRQNAGLDLNRDGRVVVREVDLWLHDRVERTARQPYLVALIGLQGAKSRRGSRPPPTLTTATPRLTEPDDVRMVQDALRRLGFDPGPSDGWAGPKTAEAIRAFQAAGGLTVDGVVGPLTWAALVKASSLRAGG